LGAQGVAVVAGQQQGERFEAGIVADDQQPADFLRGVAHQLEQGRRRGEIDPIVIARFDRAEAPGDLVERLDDSAGGRGDDSVEGEALRLHLRAHGGRRLAPPGVERAVEIAPDRIVPARFGVAQQGERLHRASSGSVSCLD
jgi:hypothetical protein